MLVLSYLGNGVQIILARCTNPTSPLFRASNRDLRPPYSAFRMHPKAIVRDILKILSTGASAIGKIFVFDVEEAYDLGSGDTGDTAL